MMYYLQVLNFALKITKTIDCIHISNNIRHSWLSSGGKGNKIEIKIEMSQLLDTGSAAIERRSDCVPNIRRTTDK